MARRRLVRVALVAAGTLALLCVVALLLLWRAVRPGQLVVPQTLAGPDTVLLVAFDLTRDDPGIAAGLARVLANDEKRKTPRLPRWVRWLFGGGTESSLPLTAGAVLPMRVVFAVDRPPGGEAAGGLVVSLSRYSPKLAGALGAVPDPLVEGLPVVRPQERGELWTGLLDNSILLSRDPEGLRALAGRLGGRTAAPDALFEAVRGLVPPGGDGFGVAVNPGDRLEKLAHDALGRIGVESGTRVGGSLRLLPPDLLGSGFSVDLVGADEAQLTGTVLFGDARAAADGEEWVRRVLPVSLAFAGLESRFTVTREADRLHVEGTVLRIGRLWDRFLSPGRSDRPGGGGILH